MAKATKIIDITPVFTPATELPAVQELVAKTKVSAETGVQIVSSFSEFEIAAQEWKIKAESLIITSEEQKEEMKQAKAARLALKNIRVSADKKRKELKEDSANYCNAVQAVFNQIESTIKPIEKHLEDQEKFIENQRIQREAALFNSRTETLRPYSKFVAYGLPLGTMDEASFQMTFNGAKLQYEAFEKQEKENRILKEALEASQKQQADELAATLAKIKKEAEESAREELKAEIEESKKVTEAATSLHTQMVAKVEEATKETAELKQQLQQATMTATAPSVTIDKVLAPSNASDLEKLQFIIATVKAIQLPEVEGEAAKRIVQGVETLFGRVITYVTDKSAAL